MEWVFYIFALVMALAITGSGAIALRWAIRRGEMERLDEKARTIFDASEPEGAVTDRFPSRARKG